MSGPEDRPNIVILFSDQLRADALGVYGNKTTHTPAMDSLADGGAVFDSAYTPSPVCVPARSSLITGLEAQNGACYENESAMPDVDTFMDALSAAGYRTHGIGKMHFTPDSGALRGFESRETGEEFGNVESDDYLAYVAKNGFDFVEHPHGLRDEMYYVPQLSPLPEHLHHSHWVASRSIEFIERQAAERPFLLWSSFIAPHPPFAPPSPWHRRFEPSVMPDSFVPPGSESLLTVYNALQNRYKYRDGGHDRRLNQLIKAFYFASVSYLDSQIARILTALDRSGQRDNTVVVLAADHGELLGDYGSFGKRSFLDAAARIPLIVNGSGWRGRRSDPASLIDIYPTLLELAGIAGPTRDGRSLLEVDEDRVVFGQYQQGELGLYCVVSRQWKYIWSAFDRREYLLDRICDPCESMNLAYNPRRRAALLRMRSLALGRFYELRDANLDQLSSNVPLRLGAPPDENSIRSMQSIDFDREASTLVVRGGPWVPELAE